MAYAFSAVDELLKGQQGGQPVQGSNIFAAEQPQQVGAQTQDGAGQGSMEKETGTKTIAEGGGAGSASAANPQATSGGDTGGGQTARSQADRAAIQANVGKTAAPTALGNIQSQLKANTERLQKEADQYMRQEQGKQQYKADAGTVRSAIGPKRDEGAFQYVSQLLGRQTAEPVGQFKASDVGVKGIESLGTQAGLKNLLRTERGPSYTGGMAAFDLRALQKTPEFGRNIRDIQAAQEQLRGDVASTTADVESGAAEYGAGQLQQAQKTVRDLLAGEQEALRSGNLAEAQAYNQQLAGLDLGAVGGEAAAQAAEAARQSLGAINPYATRFVDPAAVGNIADYISRGQERGAESFISADEAARYNNIMALLGQGGQGWSASAPITDAGSNYAVDRAALQNRMLEAAQRGYGEYERGALGEIGQIRSAAEQRAAAEQERLAGLVGEQATPEWAQAQAQAALEGSGFGQDLRQYESAGILDPTQYLREAPVMGPITGADVLTAEEAARLNELGGTIMGGQTGVEAGAYEAQDPNAFERERFLEDMRKTLTERAALAQGVPNFEESITGRAAPEAMVDPLRSLPAGPISPISGIPQAVQRFASSAPIRGLQREAGNLAQSFSAQAGGGINALRPGGGEAPNLLEQAREAALRARLMAANEALEAAGGITGGVKDIAGGVTRAAKQLGGTIASGAKDVGGDISQAYKTSVLNPVRNVLRRLF